MGIYNNLCNYLTNGLRLPAVIIKDPGHVVEAGTSPKTVPGILTSELDLHRIPKVKQAGQIQYLCNKYYECFIYAWLPPDLELWVGPCLTSVVTDNMISELIRTHKLPIRQRAKLKEHYAALPILTEDQYFYAGQIMDKVLGDEESLYNLPSRKNREAAPVLSARREAEHRLSLFEHPPYFMELEMTRLVTTGDVENALATMNQINTFNRARLADDPVRSIKNSLICNCTFLARAAIAGGVSPEEAFALSDKLIMKAENSNSIKVLERQELENLIEFVELVHMYNTNHYSKPIREVISYINEHLSEKILLQQLAERAFLHPNYLSVLFKKETDDTLTQYILKRRIEEAKFFLRYTGNTVADIAAFYQFSSQSYFIKCFKKIVGQTPVQYRNSSND